MAIQSRIMRSLRHDHVNCRSIVFLKSFKKSIEFLIKKSFRVFTGIGSITTLTVLALWRCQHVVWRPSNGNSNFTGRLNRRHGALLLTFIWTYTLVVTCPPLFGWGLYDREAAHIRYLTISKNEFSS